jgi:hypothetical protein
MSWPWLSSNLTQKTHSGRLRVMMPHSCSVKPWKSKLMLGNPSACSPEQQKQLHPAPRGTVQPNAPKCMCVHTCMHVYTHTHTHTPEHVAAHTHRAQTPLHATGCVYTDALRHSHLYTLLDSCVHTHSSVYTPTPTLTVMNPLAHTSAHPVHGACSLAHPSHLLGMHV